jgi:hypothetical protein
MLLGLYPVRVNSVIILMPSTEKDFLESIKTNATRLCQNWQHSSEIDDPQDTGIRKKQG